MLRKHILVTSTLEAIAAMEAQAKGDLKTFYQIIGQSENIEMLLLVMTRFAVESFTVN